MKYALIIPDGAADLPREEFDNKTVLQASDIANLDELARIGRVGTVQTIPDGMTPGSDVAIMSVLGYDPDKYYTGRSPIEAAAMGLDPADDQIVFRCNFVTTVDGVMEDFSAGHIKTDQAAAMIDTLNEQLGSEDIEFHAGISYRHVMITKPASKFAKLETTPPHDIMDQRIADHLPRGDGADWLEDLMKKSEQILADHPANKARIAAGDKPATRIWLWGEGQKPSLTPFMELYGKSGAVVTAVDLVRGLGKLIGFDVIEVEGATGYIDTNYAGKADAACRALDEVDLAVVHVEAPDEAGHSGDSAAKKQAIEDIDRQMIGPVLEKLRTFAEWRIMVLPDHPTPISIRSHTADPVPFVIAGSGVSSNSCQAFDEEQARATGSHVSPGWQLMKQFLNF